MAVWPKQIARRAITTVIGAVCLVLTARAIAVLGLVTPVVVQGSSMAPTLEGAHWRASCSRCGHQVTIGLDQAPASPAPECLVCGAALARANLGHQPASRLWIDRRRADPRRWDLVVFRCPGNANEFCIKRVYGRPGDVVTIDAGDVFVNDQRFVKSLRQQIEVRRLEHLSIDGRLGWESEPGAWRREHGRWQGAARAGAPVELRRRAPVYDDLPGNVAVRRRFNRVSDLMIETGVLLDRSAILQVLLPGGHATIDLPRGVVSLSNHEEQLQTPLPSDGIRRLLVSNFDRRLLVAINGRQLLKATVYHADANPAPMLRVVQGSVTLEKLALYKDIYYEGLPSSGGLRGDQPWRMGPDEFFVLGDNQAVSVDSRRWGHRPGLPRRLIVGQPHPWKLW